VGLPFRAARPVALLLDDGAPVIVESDVHGVPYDGSAMAMHDPCALVGAIAAALHRLDVDAPGPATRREVALAEIAALEERTTATSNESGAHEAIVRDAIAFAKTMLPRAEPTRFVHGRLLEANILQSLEPDDHRVGVVGFERATRGDPARELATLTRGMKKPFGVDDGFDRTLDEYARAGGAPIEASDVRVYEALLLAGVVRASYAKGTSGGSAVPPETQRLVALLKRA
jgi:aminoglycoside phosphotransferase (APT) family kinase protein